MDVNPPKNGIFIAIDPYPYLQMSNHFWWRKNLPPRHGMIQNDEPKRWAPRFFRPERPRNLLVKNTWEPCYVPLNQTIDLKAKCELLASWLDSRAYISSHKYDFLGYGWNAIHKPSSMRESVGELAIHCHSSNSSLGTTPGETWDLL